ncbi:MAG: hypothetical protein E6Q36_04990 [Chryseobacterium sp.]|nr:MAG: hypothetical protein E6Q36_04990 [Chryseobacterium sp.]
MASNMIKLFKKIKTHKKQIAINSVVAVAYVLSTLSMTLFIAYLLYINTDLAAIPVDGGSSTGVSDQSAGYMRLTGYLIAFVMSIVSLAIFICLPYLIATTYSSFVRWIMRVLKLPRKLVQFSLLKMIIMSLPLIGFSVLPMFTQNTNLLSALMIINLICSVVAIALVYIHHRLAKRHKLPLAKVW